MKRSGVVQDHVHKYQRFLIGDKRHVIYRCMLPDCTHFLPNKEFLPGRRSICWRCGEEMILKQSHVGTRKPTCEVCKLARTLKKQLSA